jgi:NADPH-dependent 2,4-dienoyl-CoA reductase/sulfur reductase-like enzyme
MRFAAGLLATPSKLAQAAMLFGSLTPRRYRTDSVVTAAHGATQVESVTIRSPRRDETIACDRLATGHGLVPNVSLAQALGCAVHVECGIVVDENQWTSVEYILAAGECTGVGGMERARAEGALAAYAALAVENASVSAHRQARARWRKFAAKLDCTFELGEAALARPSAETIFCRCEDVAFGDMTAHSNWRDAKLHTRCGMGACQGRVCGAAAQSLLGWDVSPPRAPFSPARIETLMMSSTDSPL